ncbi:MAG: ferritin [Pedobacter sp.]|nr:MAG: ferritin [Pedobacter sp.]
MKDIIRTQSMLSTDVEFLLNQQVKKEAHASASYLAMASWCDRNGYDNSADYFYKQSEEERTHQMKIFKFINDLGGNAISPEIAQIKLEFNAFREVFEDALEQEISVTQSLKNIAAKCHKEQDYVTLEFLNWFFKEQKEEEYKARRALELFDVIGEEGIGRYQIDKQINHISYSEE